MENMEKLNIESLLSSTEFTNQVNQIANSFGVSYSNDIKNDVRQACAIAVWESLEKYDEDKVGKNFWGYAYLRMREYAKREVYNQKNLVHIPMNKTSEWTGWRANRGLENNEVTHSYEGLTWEDGHNKPFEAATNDVDLALDTESALKMLDDETRYIVEVHSEIREGRSGKSDFGTLSEELGIPVCAVRKRFNAAKEQLAAYLG